MAAPPTDAGHPPPQAHEGLLGLFGWFVAHVTVVNQIEQSLVGFGSLILVGVGVYKAILPMYAWARRHYEHEPPRRRSRPRGKRR